MAVLITKMMKKYKKKVSLKKYSTKKSL